MNIYYMVVYCRYQSEWVKTKDLFVFGYEVIQGIKDLLFSSLSKSFYEICLKCDSLGFIRAVRNI